VFLIEILLPVSDNDGKRFDIELFAHTRDELIHEFGGITAFFRSPAAGAWAAPDGTVQRDTIVVLEVMSEDLNRGWWHDYRGLLERRFAQDAIVVRASQVSLL
jgi:hypothetical protein